MWILITRRVVPHLREMVVGGRTPPRSSTHKKRVHLWMGVMKHCFMLTSCILKSYLCHMCHATVVANYVVRSPSCTLCHICTACTRAYAYVTWPPPYIVRAPIVCLCLRSHAIYFACCQRHVACCQRGESAYQTTNLPMADMHYVGHLVTS